MRRSKSTCARCCPIRSSPTSTVFRWRTRSKYVRRFLDTALVEFVGTLPGSMKVTGKCDEGDSQARSAKVSCRMRRSTGPKKVSFCRSTRGSLTGCAADRRSVLGGALSHGLFARPTILRLLREHREHAADHTYKLWTLLMFQLWHELVVVGKSRTVLCPADAASTKEVA